MRKRPPKFTFLVAGAALMALAATQLIPIPAEAQVDWWPSFRHDSANTAYSTTTAPTNACLKWCIPGVITLSSPTVANGRVYAASLRPDDLCCFDAETGEELWCQPTGPTLFSSPTVADGKVYIATASGDIMRFDAETGAGPDWGFWTECQINSSPTVAYGLLYVGTDDGDIICLDASYGYDYWSYPTGGEVISTPAVSNFKVYAGSSDSKVYCLDAFSGDWIWDFTTGGGIFASPAVTDTTVYIGSQDGSIYCLDADNGDLLWEYPLGDSIYSSPALTDSMVYVATKDGHVFAFDADNPYPPVWVQQILPGEIVLSSPAVTDSIVCLATLNGFLYGFDALDGEILWIGNLRGGPAGSPAIADSTIYMISGGYLYALDGEPYAQNVHIHDVNPSRTAICQGDSIIITVNVSNYNAGCTDPVSFNCIVYYDELTATSPAQQEMFRSLGDINREGFIDTLDYILMGNAWLSTPDQCHWNPDADLNGDLIVDVVDAYLLMLNYPNDIWTYFGLGEQPIIAREHVFEMPSSEHGPPLDLLIEWKTADVPGGTHWISAYVSRLPNEYEIHDNEITGIEVNIVPTFALTITATEGQTTDPAPGTYPCPCNDSLEVEALPDFWFSYWELDGENIGSENPYWVFMDENHTLNAVYKSIAGEETSPPALSLSQNYPNPFNPFTNIIFTLPRDYQVSIKIFDASGRLIRVLLDEYITGGRHEKVWDGRDDEGRIVASGVYFCRMEAGTFEETKKMLLLR
jgi:outer membrane protein assembly factor BamB